MKTALWFVLIAAVLVTLAAATWVVSAVRAPARRFKSATRTATPVPQPQAA